MIVKPETVSSIYKLAHFVYSDRFMKMYNANTTRFNDSDLTPLFDKLRESLLFQTRQALPLNVKCDRDIPMAQATAYISYMLYNFADILDKNLQDSDYKSTPKNKRIFTVPRHCQTLEHINTMFGDIAAIALNRDINDAIKYSHCNGATEAKSFINELGKFITAICTLRYDTGNSCYERMLSAMISRGADYFTRGYPYDVLTHDINAIIGSNTQLSIVARNDYCSTHAATEKQFIDYAIQCYGAKNCTTFRIL